LILTYNNFKIKFMEEVIMRFFHLAFISLLMIIACAQNASVEIGFNDGVLLRGTYGDIIVRVTRIEVFQSGEFTEVWNGNNIVDIPINSDDYCSITNGYIPITSGSYKKMRITIDSLSYKLDNTVVALLDSVYQFTANAFTDIIIEDNDEYRLVISIASTNWFEPDSQKIKTGHQPFEGASLKVYY